MQKQQKGLHQKQEQKKFKMFVFQQYSSHLKVCFLS